MARKLKYDMPGPDWRRSIDEVRERGWEGVFAPELAPPLRLVVEIGFGRGEFLVAQAAARPDVAFVGVELSFKRVLKLARRMARGELRNARLVLGRGETVVDELLAPASVDEFWINFPDPWPKKRHAKNRLVQPPLVHALATRLVPGGVLHAATDDTAYAEHFSEVRRRYGAVDLALLPIGAYAPREMMKAFHMNPAEAVRAQLDLDARVALAIHYGTFQLSAEDFDQPVRDLRQALKALPVSRRRAFLALPEGRTKLLRFHAAARASASARAAGCASPRRPCTARR